MDQRLEAVRTAFEAGDISSAALLLLSGVAADADREEDLGTLEETLDLARAIADSADGRLRDDAEELIAGCKGRLTERRPVWWDE